MDDDDLLDSLLSVASKELSELQEKAKLSQQGSSSQCKEVNLFHKEIDKENQSSKPKSENGMSFDIQNQEDDSSDEEDRRNPEDKKYNEYGREIKNLLKSRETSVSEKYEHDKTSTWKNKSSNQSQLAVTKKIGYTKPDDVYTDPVFGLRIINPLISSTELLERMMGKMTLPFSRIKNFVQKKEVEGDYVIAGVIINKSAVKTSQKGSQYSIWFLSDLKNDIKTISLFLFGNSHKNLWKTSSGTVVAVLNPTILDKKDNSKDEGCFSVDSASKVMLLGQSKDLGVCRSKKKNGEPCTSIVNVSNCEYCIYHIKQEYQNCSRRSDLQSGFSGKGLTALRNKVLGKDQVFYAGKLYTSVPAKKSRKHMERDEARMQSLSGVGGNSNNIVKAKNRIKRGSATNLEISVAQRKRDLEILRKLGVDKGNTLPKILNGDEIKPSSTNLDIQETKNIALDVINKLKSKKNENIEKCSFEEIKSTKSLQENTTPSSNFESSMKASVSSSSPSLFSQTSSGFISNGAVSFTNNRNIIDLNTPITKRHIDRAKLNAIKYIQKNGPIQKSDPNSVSSQNKKRSIELLGTSQVDAKSPKIQKAVLVSDTANKISSKVDLQNQKIQKSELFSDRFKKMMEATSKHVDLLEQRDEEEQEKYFYRLEVKEKMEEKMSSTFKVACKAVRCLKCKYTSFSATDLCKAEKHPLRVFDAMKRFFKCGHCGNRTVSLNIIPSEPCKNCGSGKWEKTGMMKEKVVQATEGLSIRGGEQKFINSVATDTNINLLVPDDE